MPAQSICRHKTLHQYKPFLCFVTAIRTRISCFAPAQYRRRNTTALHAAHRCVFLLREIRITTIESTGKVLRATLFTKRVRDFCFAVFAVAGKQTCGSHFSLPLVKRAEIKKGFPQGRKTPFLLRYFSQRAQKHNTYCIFGCNANKIISCGGKKLCNAL